MSVQQVKDRVEELATYLGRDATGLEKLRKLKDAVNVLRTRLSSSEENKRRAVELCDVATSRLTVVEAELAALRIENHRLQQVADTLLRDMESATRTELDHNEQADNAIPVDGSGSPPFRAVMKRLRKQINQCPTPITRAVIQGEDVGVYSRNAFSKGWSHEALWTLGASVAALAAFAGNVVVRDRPHMAELDGNQDGRKHQFLQWFRSNIEFGNPEPIATVIEVSKAQSSQCGPLASSIPTYRAAPKFG